MATRSKKKLGRNDPCHCGSGKKYKKCHLTRDEVARKRQHTPPVPPDVAKNFRRQLEAREAVRKNQQGEGKPIISTEYAGYRVVAAGDTIYWSPKDTTRTFSDFLNRYIKQVLGAQWLSAELNKQLEERHPVLLWYHEVTTLQKQYAGKKGELFTMPATGAMSAYNNLAYNLYLLQHNAEVQEHLLERIRNRVSFHSGYYETYVAAWFILAGFSLNLENERDSNSSHCEFIATSPSGGKFSVEAKTRQAGKDTLAIGNQLYAALKKNAQHQRIVFVDINIPMNRDFSLQAFMNPISQRIRDKEDMKIRGQPAPPAYVVVTNIPYHLHLQTKDPIPHAIVSEGFKIPDYGSVKFPSLIAAYRAYEKHSDIRRIIDAAVDYRIPETFDGELPEFAYGKAERLQIGNRYRFDDGNVGVLKQGLVLESSQELIMIVEIDGKQMIYQGPITDDELAAYRRHPDTFFGEISTGANHKEANTPFELFLFFYDTYKNSSREKVLEFLAGAPDIQKLNELSVEELRLVYSERITLAALAQRTEKD